jgi:hypothetical protein
VWIQAIVGRVTRNRKRSNNAEKEWAVKELVEALKRFPLAATVYYETEPSGPGTIGKAPYVTVWGDDEKAVLLDRQRGLGFRQQNPIRVATGQARKIARTAGFSVGDPF